MLQTDKYLAKKSWIYIKSIQEAKTESEIDSNLKNAMDNVFGLSDMTTKRIIMMMGGLSNEDCDRIQNNMIERKNRLCENLKQLLLSFVSDDMQYYLFLKKPAI